MLFPYLHPSQNSQYFVRKVNIRPLTKSPSKSSTAFLAQSVDMDTWIDARGSMTPRHQFTLESFSDIIGTNSADAI